MKPWMTPAMLDGVDRFWRTRSAIDLAALSEERRGKILPFIRAWAESGGGQSGEAVFRSYYETSTCARAPSPPARRTTTCCRRWRRGGS